MSVRHDWFTDESIVGSGDVWDSTVVEWDGSATWDSGLSNPDSWYERNYPEFKDVIGWTHCFDAEDEGITFYDEVDTPDYPAVGGRRVSVVPDRGALANRPLKKDGGFWSNILSAYIDVTVPGPVLHSNDKRFNGRRAWHFGTEIYLNLETYGTTGLMTRSLTGTSEYFNDGAGYGHPFFVASLGRVTSTNVSAAHIHDSQAEGNVTLGRYLLDTSKYGVTTGLGELWPSANVSIDSTQTILFMVYADTTSSWSRIVRRNSDGVLLDTKTEFTLTENPAETAREFFLGISANSWVTAVGFKAGEIEESEVQEIINWARPFLPKPETL